MTVSQKNQIEKATKLFLLSVTDAELVELLDSGKNITKLVIENDIKMVDKFLGYASKSDNLLNKISNIVHQRIDM